LNGLAVVADRETLLELAQRPEVEIIRLDRKRHLPGREWRTADPREASPVVEWNIERIGVDSVWEALGMQGEGMVVANMDTGVDWTHPALRSRYRGYDPKGFDQHRGNWYCATDEGYLYPGDGQGHGSHTMGLMVGQEEQARVGVAPGAQWIAVKAFDNQGYTYDSWIHSGFQWLLAPEGDESLAPHVVSNSWGSDAGSDTTFEPDVRALRAAGILPIFSAGNDGPERGTIGSPASFRSGLAVGATDAEDQIAAFSSRGPSPWGEVKPELVAPGVDIRSSVPGGAYDLYYGTSTAAPQVAGVAALLLQARPSLTVTETESLLTGSARPLGDSHPNNDYGSGLGDAYAAVASAMDAATISGTVRSAADGSPLIGATVRSTILGGERSAETTTNSQGHYRLVLAAGTYTVTASAFAYHAQVTPRLTLTRGQELVQRFALDLKPMGALTGRVTQAGTGSPVSATLEVGGTPAQTHSDSQSGLYILALPTGTYTVHVKAQRHRVATEWAIAVNAGESVERDFVLDQAPAILLVDSGPWYYGSEIAYFTQALDDLNYLYDLWSILQPFAGARDVPAADDLAQYDLVIWSAPQDSPGYVGADGAIADFLERGGRLFLSGQDIGYWDGGGALTYASYFGKYLKARYVQDDSGVRVVEGGDGLFSGLFFGIQGGDGAGNQVYPDEIEATEPDYATSAFRYSGDGSAGQWVGLCQPYRVLYLAFGFEAIDARRTRQDVMDRAITWLAGSRPAVGAELQVTSREPRVATAGGKATHTLRLRNTGDAGEGSEYEVSLGPFAWPVTLTLAAPHRMQVENRSLTLSLAPCASATLAVEVEIPAETGQDTTQEVTVTARLWQESPVPAGLKHSAPSSDPSETVTLTTKTPAPVLLVDDDRWYDQKARYQAALRGAGIAHDNWEVGWGGWPADGSPSSGVLAMYPIVVWFTGYDWYETLTAEEEVRLAEYLSQGGRLLFSSQDYLFTRGLSSWGVEHLGVLTYTEDLSTTVALGVPGSPVGDGLGPYDLAYSFANWSDALTPIGAAAPAFLGGHGRPIALTLSRVTEGTTYKTAFFAFAVEALAQDSMAEVMRQTVGWLSWLGNSSLGVDKTLARDGEQLRYAGLLQNDGPDAAVVRFEGQIPTHTTYLPGSVSEGGVHEAGLVIWEGQVEPESAITVTYEVAVDSGVPAGTWVNNVSHVVHADSGLSFSRWAGTRVNAPDLSQSSIIADPAEIRSGGALTYQVSLRNEGVVDAPTTTLTVTIPSIVRVVSSSVTARGEGLVSLEVGQILWSGAVSIGRSVAMTYQAVATQTLSDLRAVTSVEINDGMGVSLQRESAIVISPYRHHLLLIQRLWPPHRAIWQNAGDDVQ
jgi:uncharacterized repeat protein (TIGR01451 family)